jgi:nucleotide-binding universal stress UspA family protein
MTPSRHHLVIATAIAWAQACGSELYFAYADRSRQVISENPDGSVEHRDAVIDIAPDESWRGRQADCEMFLHEQVDPSGVPWQFRYLAGRPDRALTHLARAVQASCIIVGTRTQRSGRAKRLRDYLEHSLPEQLAHHQHRPVLAVPLSVVDWATPLAPLGE